MNNNPHMLGLVAGDVKTRSIISTIIENGILPITGGAIPTEVLQQLAESLDTTKTYGLKGENGDIIADESFKLKSYTLSPNNTLIVELEYDNYEGWLNHTTQNGKYTFTVKVFKPEDQPVDSEVDTIYKPTIKIDNIVFQYLK